MCYDDKCVCLQAVVPSAAFVRMPQPAPTVSRATMLMAAGRVQVCD